MTTEHPITPPPELVEQWHDAWYQLKVKHIGCNDHIATQAARWGADAELEACYALIGSAYMRDRIRAARRPKPPSLAEEALKALQHQIDTSFKLSFKAQERVDLIRAVLERLQELERGNE